MAAASSSSVRHLGLVYRHEELGAECRSLVGRLFRRRGGASAQPSRATVAKSIRTIFEALETRQLMSVLPAPQISNWHSLTTSDTNNPTYNTTPSIAYDPTNPKNLVAVYQVNLTNANGRPNNDQLIYVNGQYSQDGGTTWATFNIPLNAVDIAATIAAQRTIIYTEATYPTVSWDRGGNFYVSYTEHRTDNSHGMIVLQSYNMDPTNGPTLTSQDATMGGVIGGTQLGTGRVLHQWFNGIDEGHWPTVAADSNLSAADIAAMPGPLPVELLNQADPNSGDVYVAWIADWQNGTGGNAINNFNPNGVMMTSSKDGGVNFATPYFVNVASGGTGYVGNDRNITPKIVIAQGTVDGTTVAPGTVTVVWDDVNSGRNGNPPTDIIRANTVPGGASNFNQFDPSEYDILDASVTLFSSTVRTYSTGATPVAVLSALLDPGTRPEIVSLDKDGGSVTVHRNNGGGTFVTAGVTIGGLNQPVAFAAADFDDDDNIDLIVVDSVGIHLMTGTGDPNTYFNAPVLLQAATGLTDITVGNFDGDKAGLPDFAATAGSGAPGVNGLIYIGINGPAGTLSVSNVDSGGENPSSIVNADLDGDKNIDLILANTDTGNVAVAYGLGDGTFLPTTTVGTVSGPVQVAAADLDGDKLLDIVILDDNGIEWMQNTTRTVNPINPAASLITQFIGATITENFSRFTLGDVNNDSKVDIVISDAVNGGLIVGRGDGAGNLNRLYAPGVEIPVGDPADGTSAPIAVSIGDLSGDGKNDLLVGLSGQDLMQVVIALTTPISVPVTTDIIVNVAPGSLSSGTRITDFDLQLAITHQEVGQLSILLTPPAAALAKIQAVRPTFNQWTLLRNRLQDTNVTFIGRGATGTDMGYFGTNPNKVRFGTTFDDDAPRVINDGGAAPYISSFAPEGGRFTFDQILALWDDAGLTTADFEGDWHVFVTDHVINTPLPQRQFVDGVGINITMDAATSGPTTVATTTVLGAMSGDNPLSPGVANTLGIGPGISIAIDNTLGAYSPNQGRVYLAYTNRSTATGNPADNTDVQLVSWLAGSPAAGTAVLVNDDNSLTDGYSEAIVSGNLTSRGRAQFQPSVAVDQYTGTLVVTYSDARQDAARVRFATTLQTSIDGGRTFSKSAFLNQPNVVVDATTGQSITVGPRPDNGTFNDDPRFGMGFKQDVIAVGGRVYALWTGNLNGGAPNVNRLPDIMTADVKIAAGPRVVSSTMGPVSQAGDLLNAPLADGTPVLRNFVLTFDRQVDLSTIITSGIGQNVFLYYRAPGLSGNAAGTLISLAGAVPFDPVTGVDLLQTAPDMSVTSVRIPLADPTVDGTKVGTYSYYVDSTVADRIRKPTVLTNDAYLTRTYASDAANSNLVVGPTGVTESTVKVAGMPVASRLEVVTGLAVTINLLHTNVGNLSLSLLAPDGVTSYLLGEFPGAAGRNLISTVFDSDGTDDFALDGSAPYTGTFAAVGNLADLIAKLNDPTPAGISRDGDWKLVVTDGTGPDAGSLLTWSIDFRTSVASSQLGNFMDQNADATPGTAAWSATTVGDVYANPLPVSDNAWDNATKTFHTPYNNTASMPIIVSGPSTTTTKTYTSQAAQNNKDILEPADGSSLLETVSTITIGGDTAARITDLNVRVKLTHASADTLKVELEAPDGTKILLRRPDTITTDGPIADMIDLIFDDAATFGAWQVTSPGTANASGTPFSGRFQPEDAQNVGRGLSLLNGKVLAGVWKLRVIDTQPDGLGAAGVDPLNQLADWSITATTETVTVNPAQSDPTTTPSVNSVVVTFDHDMDPAIMTVPGAIPGLITPVTRIVGPLGEVALSPTYTATGANANVAVPDSTTKQSKITVGDTFKAGHVSVKLDIAHANVGDLTISLIAPDNTPVALVTQRGGSGDNFTGTILSDLATTLISAGSAPFSNTLGYRPESPLSVLAGKSVKGDWTLQVTDSTGNAVTGVITSWSLTITPQIVAVTAGDPAFDSTYTVPNRTFRVYIPDQRVSGSYSMTLSPELRELTTGFKLDSNHNAGLDAMRDAVVAANATGTTPTVPVLFNQPAAKAIPVKNPSVADSETTTSVITVTESFDVRKLAVRLNVSFANDPSLAISLTSPDGVTVRLYSGFGQLGTKTNFSNTVFDDAATTPIQNGAAPYVGSFIPHDALAAFIGHNTKGDWTLTITNSSTTVSGSLNNWSITAQKTVTNTGLGEAGSDQATVNFRIFNMGAGNSSASTSWTPVSSTGSSAVGYTGTAIQNGNDTTFNTLTAGSITDIAVDPSDPSGNTVYVATASGGIWKTTNFLTSSAGGPTYVPLTDFGPVNGLNVGSLAVFANTAPTATNVKLTGTLFATPGAYFSGFEANKALDGSTQTFFWGPNADYDYVGYNFGASTLVTQVKYAPANSFGSFMVGGKIQGSTDGSTWTDLYTITSQPLDGTLTTVTLNNPGYYTHVRYLGPAGINAHSMISELEFYGAPASTVSAGTSNRSIIIAGTGQASAGYTNVSANTTNKVLESPGVGFLLSTDGGSTWNLLDSLNNVDAAGAWLPIGSPQRDHRFLNSATFKVVVDPRPAPTGETIIYAALTGPNGGLYRSVDTGKHWTLLRAGDATDVILDLNSGTVNALSNPSGNVQTLYAGFRGEGVFMSPNRGGTWSQMLGNAGGTPLVRDGSVVLSPALTNLNQVDPNGNHGRVVLAMPSPTGNATADTLHQGWLYAAVVNADPQNFNGTLEGLYMTKDFGQNWTEIPLARIAGTTFAPTNDSGSGQTFNIVDGTGRPAGLGNYDLGLAVDPLNPAILYVTGAGDATGFTAVRVDTTRVYDAHSFYTPQDAADGGQLTRNISAAVATKDLTQLAGNNPFGSGTSGIIDQNADTTQPGAQFVNLVSDPLNPFVQNGTFYVRNATGWRNSGADAFWNPIDSIFTLPGYRPNGQRIMTMTDPVTGQTRLILATDSGVFTAVANADGSLNAAVGTASLANGSRNGNLQNAQVIAGAAQPGSLAADLAGAMFFAMTNTNGMVVSNPDVLENGNLTGSVSFETGTGGGVAVDQTGSGDAFAHFIPGVLATDFFQYFPAGTANNNYFFNLSGGLANTGGIGRTLGLIQSTGGTGPFGNTQDVQWPDTVPFNFAVNPINGSQLVIGGYTGNIYATYNKGQFWSRIGAAADLDGTIPSAFAFGAPDTASDSLSDFILVGTSGITGNTGTGALNGNGRGQVFATFTGGGNGTGNAWINLDSAGLDGSQIRSIVTNPARGSREVYVVTDKGVFHMDDASAPGATWTNVTGNLFAVAHNYLSNSTLYTENLTQTLTSVAADWRYAIPNAGGSGTHPVLYASGNAGVYRSLDGGASWTPFPNQSTDGAASDGGYLPNVKVTDLDLSLGVINPTTGMPQMTSNSASVLLASTYGRGQFAIRIAPLTFNTAFGQDVGGQRTITGFGQINGYGNSMTYDVYDLSNAAAPSLIATGLADDGGAQDGTFHITLPLGVTATKIGVRAKDAAGVVGPMSLLLVPPSTPASPDLAAGSDSGDSNSDNLTNDATPTVSGTVDAGNKANIYRNGTLIATITSDGVTGAWTYTFAGLPQGLHNVTVSQTDLQGQTSAQSVALAITIDTAGPTATTSSALPTPVKGNAATYNLATFTDAHKVKSVTINWGDGTVETINNPSPANGASWAVSKAHTYVAAGSKTITMTAVDDAGNTSSVVTRTATVNAPAHVFNVTGQVANPQEGSSFTGKVAVIEDDAPGRTAASFTASIDWGDGSAPDTNVNIVANGAGKWDVFATHTFIDNRQGGLPAFTAFVKVDSVDGDTETVGSVISVSNVLPSGTVSDPGAIYVGNAVTLNLTAADASAADVAAGFEYKINWGDGSPEQTIARTAGNGSGVSATHTFTAASSSIIVTITDKDGASRVLTKPVTVSSLPVMNASAVNGSAARSDISQITFNVSNTAVNGGLSLANLNLYYNGDGGTPLSLAGAVLTFDPASGNGTLDLRGLVTPLQDGDYQLHINVQGKTFVVSFFKLAGDLNGSGTVDDKDLTILNKSKGKSQGQAGYNAFADLNKDGVVNQSDVNKFAKLRNGRATIGNVSINLKTGSAGLVPTIDFGSVKKNTNGGYVDLLIKNTNTNGVQLNIGMLSVNNKNFKFALPNVAWSAQSPNTIVKINPGQALTVRVYLKPVASAKNLGAKLKFSFATISQKDYKDVTVPVKAKIIN